MGTQPIGYLLGLGSRPAPLNPGERLTFGRDPQNSHSFDDALLSRMHAAITVTEDGQVAVQDLNSTNYTWLNDERINPGVPMEMKNGDSFRIGGQVMTFIANNSDVHPAEMGLQKKVRMATMETIVIQKPDFSDEHEEGASTRLHQPITPIDIPKKSSSDTATGTLGQEPEKTISLEGNLKDHMFPQLIQYFHTSQKTGELLIEDGSQQVIIGFQSGNVVYALLGDDLGIGVIHTVARWQEGTFQFNLLSSLSRPKNVVHPTMTIVLKCCQIMDEDRR